MIELGTIRDLVAIFGVIAGFSYYVMTVRNSQKSQRLAEETRKTQLFREINLFYDQESIKNSVEIMNLEWTDINDYQAKYGADTNPEHYAKLVVLLNKIDYIGLLLKNGLLDRDLVFQIMTITPTLVWNKFEDVIKYSREFYNRPMFPGIQYLAEECDKYMTEKGFNPTVSKTLDTSQTSNLQT